MAVLDAIPPEDSRSWPPGWSVRYVAATGSTNADLLAHADELPDRTVLTTGHQRTGQGRLGRRWDAPPDTNLLVSILFRAVPADPHELTRRVGLAAVDAAAAVAGVAARLKWPNDVLVGDAKLAGILAQRDARGPVVVGMGLNVGWAPEGAARLGDGLDPMEVLHALLVAYGALPTDVGPRYRAALATLGRSVRAEVAGGALTGRAVDVDDIGRLVIVDECGLSHHLDAADVVHLRPSG